MLRALYNIFNAQNSTRSGVKTIYFLIKNFQYFSKYSHFIEYINETYKHYCNSQPPTELYRDAILRPFYSSAYGVQDRLSAALSHHQVMEKYLNPSIIKALYCNGAHLQLAAIIGLSGSAYEIKIHQSCSVEGFLALSLTLLSDPRPLAFLNFCFNLTDRSEVILKIGGLHLPGGNPVQGIQNQIVTELHGVDPQEIVINAIHAVGLLMEARQIEAVAAANAVDPPSKETDRFFEACGAITNIDGNYIFPKMPAASGRAELDERPFSDRYTQRAFILKIRHDCENQFRSWLRFSANLTGTNPEQIFPEE